MKNIIKPKKTLVEKKIDREKKGMASQFSEPIAPSLLLTEL